MILQTINNITKSTKKAGEQARSDIHVKPKNHIKSINKKLLDIKIQSAFNNKYENIFLKPLTIFFTITNLCFFHLHNVGLTIRDTVIDVIYISS